MDFSDKVFQNLESPNYMLLIIYDARSLSKIYATELQNTCFFLANTKTTFNLTTGGGWIPSLLDRPQLESAEGCTPWSLRVGSLGRPAVQWVTTLSVLLRPVYKGMSPPPWPISMCQWSWHCHITVPRKFIATGFALLPQAVSPAGALLQRGVKA